jgi:hypothetical protein
MSLDPAKLFLAAIYRWPVLARRHCVVCDRDVGGFLPYRGGSKGLPPAMAALGIVGSDVDHFECPRCGAHDRLRHLFLYLDRAGIFARMSGARILHGAPEIALTTRIQAQAPSHYVKCDLFPSRPGIERVDLTAMPFDDGAFDVVIANHMLEHVGDLPAALREIGRVLAPGGVAILQTPYVPMLEATLDDAGVQSAEARLQLYGQEDHVRLFGRDIFHTFARHSGLVSKVATHDDLLPDIDAHRYAVNRREPLFLFEKSA